MPDKRISPAATAAAATFSDAIIAILQSGPVQKEAQCDSGISLESSTRKGWIPVRIGERSNNEADLSYEELKYRCLGMCCYLSGTPVNITLISRM